MRFHHVFILGLSLCAMLTACAAHQDLPDSSLVFMAGYRPQANLPFVGAYVAEAQGYFREEGLEVEIRHSGGGGEHLQLLMAGKIDVTTQDATVLLKRRADPGLPLVSIGLIGQRGQQAFVALAESGMQTPYDWAGARIGFKGTPPPDLLALLDIAGLSQDDVEMVNVGFDPRVLVQGLVDIYPVFASNEPYILRKWGYSLVQWQAADYGIPTLGLTYVTTEATLEEKSEALSHFMRAVLKGIEYAETHPEQAVDAVLAYTGPETDRDHMRYMLMTELESAHSAVTAVHGIGWQTAEQWQALHDSLLQYGALAAPVDIERAFTTSCLPNGETQP